MKVLIVDDSASVRGLLRTVLRGLADEVIERSDGREALDAYREHRPDWVLMDLEMPHVDGLTATAQVTGADAAARVLVVTQYDEASLRASAARAGACGYVLKDDLLEVRRFLAGNPGASGESA